MSDETWTDEKVARLTTMWEDGVTASDIGLELGVTKNTVIGKVHRLGLPKRRRAPVPTEDEPDEELLTLYNLKSGMCSWPIGEPGNDRFHYCGAQVVTGKSYCSTHCDIAHIKPPKVNTRGIR